MEPTIIQGGMGAAVSNWRLARAVSLTGNLGVVSGTATDIVLARRLQLGDLDGKMRHALQHFPLPEVAKKIVDRYFVPGGKSPTTPFKSKPVHSDNPSLAVTELTVAANFVEVFLAKEGHKGLVGINLLEKIALPNVHSLFGAILAGVDYVLMGAGIPRQIPAILDSLAEGKPASMKLEVEGALHGEEYKLTFDPARFFGDVHLPTLNRPKFLAIISSTALAVTLARKVAGVNGFVVEGPTAGGHNAPPRGNPPLNSDGEPVYGERDVPDLEQIRLLGLPFWLAGSFAEPEKLEEAKAHGATGIQVGTAFAYCEESGIAPDIKRQVLRMSCAGRAKVFTDPLASPTGFPFKVVLLDGTMSDENVIAKRPRICDLGYLRRAYRREDGKVGYRCPSEPEEDYISKGGDPADLVGRKCVCNGLMGTIGLSQVRKDGTKETALVTSGDDVKNVARFLKTGEETYTAKDVIDYLLRTV